MITSRASGSCSNAPQGEAPRPAGARGQRRPLSLRRLGRLSAVKAAAGGGPWLLRSPGSGRDCSGAAAPPPPPVSQFLLQWLRHLLGTRKLRGGLGSRRGRCHLSPAGEGPEASGGARGLPLSGAAYDPGALRQAEEEAGGPSGWSALQFQPVSRIGVYLGRYKQDASFFVPSTMLHRKADRAKHTHTGSFLSSFSSALCSSVATYSSAPSSVLLPSTLPVLEQATDIR
ncbi:uncharacterized protein [Melanerpes formicivorus]|uniref:uncharacterized protein n=1 Tax=Melanerpes formicivorus TaxID=211600 RepID=UPI00359008E4